MFQSIMIVVFLVLICVFESVLRSMFPKKVSFFFFFLVVVC